MRNWQVVPATRLGLVLSIVGFAGVVGATASGRVLASFGSGYTFAWVMVVIALVYPPRLIRPGSGWARSPCRPVPSAVLYVAAVVVAVTGALARVTSDAGPAIVAACLLLSLGALAATLPPVTYRPIDRPAV